MRLTPQSVIQQQDFTHPTLNLAFSELLKFMDKSVGIKSSRSGSVKISFSIGKVDGYSAAVEGDTITFTASSELEILYAVYTFAEEFLGFCFLWPDDDILNPRKNIELTEGLIVSPRIPAIKNRGLIQEFAFGENSLQLADWMAKNRLNYLLVWMKYYDDMPEDMKEYYRVRGITIECGHHNFEYFIPAEKYYKTNPEFFAVIDAEPIKPLANKDGFLGGGQLCVTNKGLRQELLHNIIEYCRKNPEVECISLIPNDGFGWCQCDDCRKAAKTPEKGEMFSLSTHVDKAQEIYHDLITYISEQLRNVLPHITLTFAAYVNYIEPAKNFLLKEKTAVHFAHYWRCINHNIDNPDCPINSKYMQALQKWRAAKNGGQISLYEYYMGVNLYISLPMIHHEQMFEEVQFYKENDIDGLLTQFQPDNWTAYCTNYYLMAKAAYGGHKDAIDRLYRSIMPQNPEKIKAFYDYAKGIVDSAGPCHISYPRALLNRTKLKQYQTLHALALELAGEKDDIFLKRLVIWTEYMVRFKSVFDDYIDGKPGIIKEINNFTQWAASHQDSKVFVVKNVKILMGKWLERIQAGLPWYHYSLDWEDEYIKIHDTTLNNCQKRL